jgi:hypothetical protein
VFRTLRPNVELASIVVLTCALSACDKASTTSPGSSPSGLDHSAEARSRPSASSTARASATPEPSASASNALAPPKLRDADAEIAAVAPFDATVTDPADAKKRVDDALAICGDFLEPAAWGREGAAPKPPSIVESFSLCTPSTAAKLLAARAMTEAKDDADGAKASFSLALALDPGVVVPPAAPASVKAAFARAKKQTPPTVRTGAVTTSDASSQKALEASLASLLPHVRACYARGLLDNPNLQGGITLSFVLVGGGRVLSPWASGDIPHGGVVKCAGKVVERAVLASPSVSPAQVTVRLVAGP